MVFDINKFKHNGYRMLCVGEYESKVFSEYLDICGRKWSSGARYTDLSYYRESSPVITYKFNSGSRALFTTVNEAERYVEYDCNEMDYFLRFCDFEWGDGADIDAEIDNDDFNVFMSAFKI